MATMLNVYDLERKKTAVLQNAFNVTEEQELNKIYTLSFTLPDADDKVKYCQPFHYVRYGDDGQLYRIISSSHNDSDVGTITYTCEHVIATLVDTIMFGSYTYGGGTVRTREVINWLLSKQEKQNWVLDVCDFDRRFEYGWEQENLLNALYAIPKEFSAPYKWTFDTTGYPWKLSLRIIDDSIHPEYYLRANLNLLSSGKEANSADICTRIYPLGYGEGVNQLTIKDVNNGVPYLQAPAEVVEKYGIIEKVLADRRFENAESLKAYAQTVLDNLSTPGMTRSFSVVDLHEITNTDIDYAEVGKICKLTQDGTITYITKTRRVLDKEGDLQIDLSTKSTDVASTIADLAERVRIEAVYAQGATQLYQHSKDANATSTKGAIVSLYFPQEMKQINKVLLRMQLKPFRAYSTTTAAGGGGATTSAGGSASGSTSQSTTGGGTINVSLTGTAVQTNDANWTKQSSPYTNSTNVNIVCNSAGSHTHTPYITAGSTDFTGVPALGQTHRHVFSSSYYGVGYTDSQGSHKHGIEADDHNHTIPRTNLQHTHSVTINVTSNTSGQTGFAHSHTFNIGSHTHSVPIPEHTHNIETGIFEIGSSSSFDIYIGGTQKAHVDSTSYNDDITAWLAGSDGLIPRGQWIDMEIRPNNKAYVVASVFVQGFVQSRGGGNY